MALELTGSLAADIGEDGRLRPTVDELTKYFFDPDEAAGMPVPEVEEERYTAAMEAAAVLVDKRAPSAPHAVAREACLRTAYWLWDSRTAIKVGRGDAGESINGLMASGDPLRIVGADAMLAPWTCPGARTVRRGR